MSRTDVVKGVTVDQAARVIDLDADPILEDTLEAVTAVRGVVPADTEVRVAHATGWGEGLIRADTGRLVDG
ncbi:MAG: hypothetical protein K2W78_16445 [Xanthobacteraceae bacterium]|nr:hypothetical protein [Xanthobacteraceae bacterium]